MQLLCLMQGLCYSIAHRWRRIVALAIISIGIGIISATMYCMYRSLCSIIATYRVITYPTHVIINTDQIYSPHIKRVVQQVLSTGIAGAKPLTTLINEVKESCPLITNVIARMQTPPSVIIEVSGTQPFLLLNDYMVLAYDQRIYPRDYFSLYHLAELPTVQIPSIITGELAIAGDIFTLLQSVPSDIFDNFHLTYHNAHTIILESKEKVPPYTVIADVHSMKDTKKIRIMEQLVKVITPQKTRTLKNPLFTFDIRFTDRIIARSGMLPRGEKSHGKSYA